MIDILIIILALILAPPLLFLMWLGMVALTIFLERLK